MTEALRGTWLIARRELGSYFNTYWGYAVVAVLLLVDGLLFNAFALGDRPRLSAEVLEKFFEFSSGVTMIAGVLLTIRLFAEERQTGTAVLLDSAPLPDGVLVAGKFLSAVLFLAAMLAASVYMPALVLVNGKVSLGHVFAGYLGLLALGSATAAVGTFGSALTRSQVVAAVVSGAMVVTLVLMWLLARITEPPFSPVFQHMSLWDRNFRPFMQGRIATDALVYYGTITLLFLYATTRLLGWRRRR